MLLNNIFYYLIHSGTYFTTCYPHLESKYFAETTHSKLLTKIKEYYAVQKAQPKISDLKLLIEMDNNISESDTTDLYSFLDSLRNIERVSDEGMLIKQTESYVQQRALELAVLSAVDIIQDEKKHNGLIEDVIKQALAIEFNVQIGDDYFRDVAKRMKEYLESEDKILLNIDVLNEAMGGGLVKKAIFFFMANTGVGKSIFLAHASGSLVMAGKNVLYLTGELSVKEVNKRHDANLLDLPINSLNQTLDKKLFKNKLTDLFKKSHGELLVKYCSAGTTTAVHIKNLLNEIKIKKGFVPDVIILDHLTLFGSSRLPKAQSGTHLYIRSVVEEIRDVAIEFDCNILTACQLTRGSKTKTTDVTNEDVGLAYAISETSDWSGAIIQTEELKEQGKFLVKVMKTRFSSTNDKIYTVGIDYEHMRLSNVAECDQEIPVHIKDKLKYEKGLKDQKEESVLFEGFDFNT